MPKYLLRYSNAPKDRSLPRQGSVVELETMADLEALSASVGGHPLISHPPGDEFDAPWWVGCLSSNCWDEDDIESYHTVSEMPEGWREMRWIEVYEGFRE